MGQELESNLGSVEYGPRTDFIIILMVLGVDIFGFRRQFSMTVMIELLQCFGPQGRDLRGAVRRNR